MQRLVNTAAGLCGIPTTVRASRKYLLASAPTDVSFHHEDFEVEKVYLKPEATGTFTLESVSLFNGVMTVHFTDRVAETSKDYSFVRCRSQYGIPAYGMTTVRYLDTGDA